MSDHAFNIQPMPDPYREAERRAADTRTPSFTDDEMEAIRRILYCVHNHSEACTCGYEVLMGELAVTAWVLGDPSPAPPALRWVLCGDHRQIMYDTGEYLVGSVPCPSCGGEK